MIENMYFDTLFPFRAVTKSVNILFLILLLPSCSKNLFSEVADKSSDSYAIDRARVLIDEKNFTDAIAAITPVLGSQPRNEDVAFIAADAYAGRAGLRVLDLFTQISGKKATLFKLFAAHMSSATSKSMSDSGTAVAIIEHFGYPASKRDSSFNFFALFVYFANIGAIINHYGYSTTTDTPNASFDACLAAQLPETSVDQIMTDLSKILDILNNLGSSIGGIDKSLFISGLPDSSVSCPASGSNATLCSAVRTLVDGSTMGLGLGYGACP